MGEQAGLTIDRVVREVIMAGTSIQYANGRVSRVTVAAGDLLTVLEIRKAVRTLKAQNIQPVAGGDYVAFVSPFTTFDLQSDAAWKDPHTYQDTTNIYTGEIGRLYGVRFVETTEAKVFTGLGAAGINVYATLIVGKDAYGMIPLEGGDLEFYHIPQNTPDKSDPLQQRWTTGWKVSTGVKVLSELAMVRIEHSATNG